MDVAMLVFRRHVLLLVAIGGAACSGGADELPDARPLPDGPATPDGPADAQVDAMVDAMPQAPETTITDGPPALDNSLSVTFQFESDIPGSTFRCRLDSQAELDCSSPQDVSGLTDGAHEFFVTAYNQGVPDPTPASWPWTIDSSTPDTQIDDGPGGSTGSVVGTTSATFQFSSPDAGAGATFECALDGAAFSSCTSGIDYTSLTEGPHDFAVRVRDMAGNPDPTPATWTWTVDLTPPNTTIVGQPDDPTNATMAGFSFTSSEPNSTFECRIDAGAFASCGSPFSAVLTAGTHTFRVRATDEAGNTDPTPALYTWTIDLTPPNTTLGGGPADPTNQTTASFTVGSNEPGSTIACRIDGGGFADCTSGTVAYAGLSAGSHTVEAVATDPAGNPDPTPATATWTIDLLPPTVTNVTSNTAAGAYNAGAAIDVRVTFSEVVTASGSPTITVETGAVDRTATFAAGSGTATLRFTYTVAAGDTSADLDYTSANALAGSIVDAAGNAATLTLPTPGAPGSLAANEAIVIDTTAPAVANVTSTTVDGPYAVNEAVNVRVVFSEAVTVAGGTPTVTLETGAVNRTAVYASGSGTTTLDFTYLVQAGDVAPDLDYTNTGALAFGGASIEDAAGNSATLTLPAPGAPGSLAANKDIEIDGIPPTVTNVTSPMPNGTYNDTAVITIQVQFTETVVVTNVPTLNLETGAIDRDATYSTGSATPTLAFVYLVEPGDQSPDLDYRLATSLAGTIRDVAGNNATLTLPNPGTAGSLGANKAIVIDAVAPTVTITSPADGASVGPRVTYSWTVNDGSPTTCSFDGSPAMSCTSPVVTNIKAGPHTLAVFATDGAGNTGSDTNNFTVVCGPQTGPVPPGIALFHMDESSGQPVINSIPPAPNAVLGTDSTVELDDPTRTTAGRFGSALDFDQVSRDTVHWTTGLAAPITLHNHTIEMWAQMSPSTSPGGGDLFRSGDGRIIVRYHDNGAGQMTVLYRIMDDAGNQRNVQSAAMPYDVFRHIVATYAGTTMTLWVDGVSATNTASVSGNLNLGTVELGTSNNHIDGIVDELYVANGALTASQVLDRYCPL
jgi:hypothetical protein